jgi:uncharacterized protein
MTEAAAAVRTAVDTNRTGSPRLPGLDVARAVALIGVVVMNYHGYLNGGDDGVNRSLAEHAFDPVRGPLTTRFAAVFVLVAGMGVTLLTNRSRRSGDRTAIREDRWRLARRGLLLYSFGLLIEWIWPGTILFFYGAFFMLAAVIFTLRIRWLVVIGATAALAGAAIAWFRIERSLGGHSTDWLEPRITSPRNLLLRTFIGYTHPLLPWLAFFCAGIILGRFLPQLDRLRGRIIAAGLLMFVGAYAINFFGLRWATDNFESTSDTARRWRILLSTAPFDRGLLYTTCTLGSSLVAFSVIDWCANRFAANPLTQLLRHAGQMTLTVYVAHVLVFNALVHWWRQIGPTGLDTALMFSLLFWVFAICLGAFWHRFLGMGPLERVYRGFGG